VRELKLERAKIGWFLGVLAFGLGLVLNYVSFSILINETANLLPR
jgi:hypothetical protein